MFTRCHGLPAEQFRSLYRYGHLLLISGIVKDKVNLPLFFVDARFNNYREMSIVVRYESYLLANVFDQLSNDSRVGPAAEVPGNPLTILVFRNGGIFLPMVVIASEDLRPIRNQQFSPLVNRRVNVLKDSRTVCKLLAIRVNKHFVVGTDSLTDNPRLLAGADLDVLIRHPVLEGVQHVSPLANVIVQPF